MRFTGLWRHREFRKLWAGQAISAVGHRMVFLALPLTAIVVLDASPAQMGVIIALGGLPALVAGAFVGVWVDRHKRRPILIATDWARVLLILSIPIAHQLDALTIGHIYVVAAGLGTLSLFFEVAYRSFLPSLVSRGQLVEGNSKLQVARSGAEVAGPGIAGGLVQAITAPFAVGIGAGAFMLSAIFLQLIRGDEAEPEAPSKPERALVSLREGVRFVWGSRLLIGIAGALGTASLFNAAHETIDILYMVRRLDLNPGAIGAIFAVGGLGLVAGAAAANRLYGRVGVGPAMIFGLLVLAASDVVLPLIGGPTVVVVAALMIASVFFGLGLVLFDIGQVSLRQGVTPDRLLGRMNAVMAVMRRGAIPAGAVVGAALAEIIGLRAALIVAVIGEASAVGWLLYSRLWSVREMPAAPSD